VKYDQLSADHGKPFGQFGCRVWFEEGIGIDQNVEEAVKYSKLPADPGEASTLKKHSDLIKMLKRR
jgi:hypothetical protein